MYWAMSLSRFCRAAVYALLPLPPGTSLSWTPPSSLYCCQKSVSRISAAATNRRIASSPFVRLRRAEASGTSANIPTPSAAAPAPARKERLLVAPDKASPLLILCSLRLEDDNQRARCHQCQPRLFDPISSEALTRETTWSIGVRRRPPHHEIGGDEAGPTIRH